MTGLDWGLRSFVDPGEPFPDAAVGEHDTQLREVTFAGTGPTQVLATSGSLPPGLTFKLGPTGMLLVHGVPTTPGVFRLTIRLADTYGKAADHPVDVTVGTGPAPPPAFVYSHFGFHTTAVNCRTTPVWVWTHDLDADTSWALASPAPVPPRGAAGCSSWTFDTPLHVVDVVLVDPDAPHCAGLGDPAVIGCVAGAGRVIRVDDGGPVFNTSVQADPA